MKRNLSLAIVHMMHGAKEHIKYPKIRLEPEGLKIQLSVAGEKAKFPNSINITDGKPYGESNFYGRIHADGTTEYNKVFGPVRQNDINMALELFADDPIAYAKLYSNATGNCMFCCRELTDPQSVGVGYGPICAENYNLPHGNIDIAAIEIEHDMAGFELHVPSSPQLDNDIPVSPEIANEFNSFEERKASLDAIDDAIAALCKLRAEFVAATKENN